MRRARPLRATLAALVAASAVGVAAPSGVGASEMPWLDTADRQAVIDSQAAAFPPTSPAGGVADIGTCEAGTTDAAHRDAVAARVNWYRRMAGLAPVRVDGAASDAAQQTALMMAAQGSLSHAPGPGWACYHPDGAAAAGRSNLALGVNGPASIDAYIRDPGAANLAVGHRRTILYPQLQEIGVGDVEAGDGHHAAGALVVFDDHIWDARPAVREPRGFVAWPPSGYVPADAVWGRWSFSLAGADFSGASVTVAGPDGPEPLEIVARLQAAQVGTRMAPEPSIVWAIGGDTDSTPLSPPTDGDECYIVTVAGVRLGGVVQHDFRYRTCVIDPDDPGTPAAAPEPPTCHPREFSAWTSSCWREAGAGVWFGDVVAPWQQRPVAWLVANEITTGVGPGRFDPNAHLTRAQAATFVWRLAGSPAPPRGAPEFTDVASDEWYHDAVRWMASNGITTGTGQGRFAPDATATRAEFVTFLWRLVDRPAVDRPLPFADLRADWQRPAVRWASTTGITTGTSTTTFDPDGAVTRGQTAALLARLADAIG